MTPFGTDLRVYKSTDAFGNTTVWIDGPDKDEVRQAVSSHKTRGFKITGRLRRVFGGWVTTLAHK